MKNSIVSLVGNIGNTIKIGTPLLNTKNNHVDSEENNNYNEKKDILNTSPSRPLGLPPPLPYSKINNDELNEINTNSSKKSFLFDNPRMITPFHTINSANRTLLEDDFNINEINNKNTPLTKSIVRIKSMGQTPRRINNNISSVSPIFTPLNSKSKFLLQLPTSPRGEFESNEENRNIKLNKDIVNEFNSQIEKIDSVFLNKKIPITKNNQEISSKLLDDDKFETTETTEILRKRLNEKNQEIHFLRKTIKDLEIRMNNFENKEKVFIENEINTKKKMQELITVKQEFKEKLDLMQDQLIKLEEEKNNIFKENKCLSSNLELKNYEINKLNDEIIYLQTTYKNNFIDKYLNPIKNILYDFIIEIEDKINQKVIINVDFNNNNFEIDIIVKTLHEYINHLKNIISSKMSEDSNIIERLHFELNKINKQYFELRQQYENIQKDIENNYIAKDVENNNNVDNKDEIKSNINNYENDKNNNNDDLNNDNFYVNNIIDNNNNNNNNNNDNNNNNNNDLENKNQDFEYKNNYENKIDNSENNINNTNNDNDQEIIDHNFSNYIEEPNNKNKSIVSFGLTNLAKSLLSYTYIGNMNNKNDDNQKNKTSNLNNLVNSDNENVSKSGNLKKKKKTTNTGEKNKKVVKKIEKKKESKTKLLKNKKNDSKLIENDPLKLVNNEIDIKQTKSKKTDKSKTSKLNKKTKDNTIKQTKKKSSGVNKNKKNNELTTSISEVKVDEGSIKKKRTLKTDKKINETKEKNKKSKKSE